MSIEFQCTDWAVCCGPPQNETEPTLPGTLVKKKLPLALDCSISARQAFFVVCLWGSFHQDGVEVMGKDQASVGGSVCDGLLAEL